MMSRVEVVGGGLAGSEAALYLARQGFEVTLREMKPLRYSAAHKLPGLAELVCSNSLKSDQEETAAGLLKGELRLLGSSVLALAERCRVPAGATMAVDREKFSLAVTQAVEAHPAINLRRELVQDLTVLEQAEAVILATGPLTDPALLTTLAPLIGKEDLYFYDAISPIVDGTSIDRSIVFAASRYEKGSADYLNIPLDRREYEALLGRIVIAEKYPLRDFEEPRFFEACLPLEVMVERGAETLAYGPFKPVGLLDPRTGTRPYAVVQLRRERLEQEIYSLVGFQTRMVQGAQREVIRALPGLAAVEILRYGSIHRNTFFNSPNLLRADLSFGQEPRWYLAGQLSGVEGYLESTAMGLVAGKAVEAKLQGRPFVPLPRTTLCGALCAYLTDPGNAQRFQPMSANYGLLPPLDLPRSERKRGHARRALAELERWVLGQR
ncbi:MAG: methylenetetrahydrofolate--tRNA-(uracil(54)-C(5))-methyltransferase (FADH(2)-oxidizing) TrmFO [Deltaproteobacteria bacterium RIFOXYA12_FULL_61_11]|nr:MAG: methylenetetrahydrofolate--tRNA-(uracil(54)-C(5))-methyltransferase (FADH(2)-oxidizing) TrmFO [Deltaproteobacteria bacterium RIFOXYA12_FULL_61_11]